jgi:hypothetical protein
MERRLGSHPLPPPKVARRGSTLLSDGNRLGSVSVKGGVVGGVLGFIVLIIIAEWIFVDWFGHHDALEAC